ncbi:MULTISPECIES: hypothetical protein [Streptomyces]|uniref:hypothetical protein n=1 Tax=Streptomyces TaxID=1883 RepID=UPI00163D2CE4|nr:MULTISPECIES: hypothetical protein [Streptomyces]GLX18505.1 hypothetical protein Slala01_21490 [Streptomyces lavendulae subsp. lavendulae]GLX30266.1 hypothetical protein Slala02_60860 [Streptomyces lavendulae subsp. lavendulae]
MRLIPVHPAPAPCHTRFDEAPSSRVVAEIEPSPELLHRALAGWERFLVTFEAASGE